MIAYRVFQLGVPAILGIAAFAGLRKSLSAPEAAPAEPREPNEPSLRPAPLEPA